MPNKDTGNVPLFYNQLVSFLNGLNTNIVSNTNVDVANMMRKVDDLEPELVKLNEIAGRTNYT